MSATLETNLTAADGLTAEMITKLRRSVGVTFRWEGKVDDREELGVAVVFKKNEDRSGRDGDVFDKMEILGSVRSYARGYQDGGRVRAVASITGVSHNEYWQTFLAMLRVGDVLVMEWVEDNSNQYTRASKLFRDELLLRIRRKRKDLVFRLQVGVCEDNSGRMIRRVTEARG